MSNEVLCAVIIFKVSSHFVQVIIGRHFNLVSVPDPLRLSGQRRERSGLKPINYSLLAFSLRNFAKLRKEALFLSFLWSVISVALGVFSHQNSRENDCTRTAWVLLWRDRQIIFNPHCSYGDLRTNFITKLQSVKNCEKKIHTIIKKVTWHNSLQIVRTTNNWHSYCYVETPTHLRWFSMELLLV